MTPGPEGESLLGIATPISSDVLKAVFQVHGIDAADGSLGLVGKSVQKPAAFAQIVPPRTADHKYIETDQSPVAIHGNPRQCDERKSAVKGMGASLRVVLGCGRYRKNHQITK